LEQSNQGTCQLNQTIPLTLITNLNCKWPQKENFGAQALQSARWDFSNVAEQQNLLIFLDIAC